MTTARAAAQTAARVLALTIAMTALPALAARPRTVCVSVAIEGIQSLVCSRPAKRR